MPQMLCLRAVTDIVILADENAEQVLTLNTSTKTKISASSRLTIHPLGTHDTTVSMIVCREIEL